jgi:hypothetical protein
MHGHCLRRVFYTACNPQLSASAQRIVGGAMAAAQATDTVCVPAEDCVEQAHAAMMRNMPLDPRSV